MTAQPYDRTEMGGEEGRFRTTHWTEILRSRTRNDAHRREVMGQLFRRYWKPVYCYLRRKGHDNETAKDLTQGFFQDVVLGRRLMQRAERSKGRFRTFLLTALDHYVTSVHRARTAKKRAPDAPVLSLDGGEGRRLPEPARTATPEEAFHHAWAAALLDAVLGEVERECLETGKETHWRVFRERVLAPIRGDAPPTPLADLCARYHIASEMTASNMLVTVKRAFRAALRRHVRAFVESDTDVDEEIQELIRALSTKGAG